MVSRATPAIVWRTLMRKVASMAYWNIFWLEQDGDPESSIFVDTKSEAARQIRSLRATGKRIVRVEDPQGAKWSTERLPELLAALDPGKNSD
jgi:hypothetical protein